MKKAVVAVLCTSLIAPHTRVWKSGLTPRASSRPMIGAVTAWVSGTPNCAGPMIATVSSMAATLAPNPWRSPRRSATRANATPPARPIQKPPVGVTREARKDTVATCAGPAGGGSTRPKLAGGVVSPGPGAHSGRTKARSAEACDVDPAMEDKRRTNAARPEDFDVDTAMEGKRRTNPARREDFDVDTAMDGKSRTNPARPG